MNHPRTTWLGVRLPRMFLTLGAVGIVLFAVMPWVDMGHDELAGPHVTGVTDFGDGRVVAILGLLILLLRVSFIWLSRWRAWLLSAIAALAFGVTGVAAYDAFRDWYGEPTVWLYGEVLLGATVAICAGVLMGGRASEVEAGEPGEVTEAWA